MTGVTLNSATVMTGDLYAGLPGAKTHGARFSAMAVSAGAAAILTDGEGRELAEGLGVPVLVCPDPRGVLGEVSALVYGYPARRLRTFAVTGTNGKTTVTYLLAAALQALGVPTALIGTTGTWLGDRRLPTVRTTPEAPDVQALMAMMADEGIQALAMEVSSHALVLGRVDGIRFDVSSFTNLSPDHLDFHMSMDEYFAAKADLFTGARTRRAVVNVDDQWGRRLAQSVAVPLVTYGFAEDAEWRVGQVESDASGSKFDVIHGDGTASVRVGAPGAFNVANALGALVMLVQSGYPMADAARAIGSFRGVPGRMEVVRSPADPPAPVVIVDYAHTPDAVERALLAVRPLTQGKIWCVLGCGGDRDAVKRPAMGRISAERADQVVVTDDNPRSEDPAGIRAAVMRGARGVPHAHVQEVDDRARAIALAIQSALPEDTVMILGKGHETGQEVDGIVHPFDDRIVAREALGARA
ncbi:MAG: UDP-N-acetylmuramoyl-L-alanyl-D-glutamate--2,6-diaminopimelate ligase [Candidatus Nanopelagicales bacterium]